MEAHLHTTLSANVYVRDRKYWVEQNKDLGGYLRT